MGTGDWRVEFRPDIASPARVYGYLLGGKDHYPADREVAENIIANLPGARMAALQNRAFLGRAVRYLAAEAGIRQFLDIGTGLPSAGQVHEIAQGIAPESRIVYVDNDPVVIAHGRDILHGNPHTLMLKSDFREPEKILGDDRLRQLIDFDRPVAVLLVAILHFVSDADDPYGIVQRLMKPMPPGSHLVISHGTLDSYTQLDGVVKESYNKTTASANPRTRAQVEAFFAGFDLIDPGLVWTPQWRPDPDTGMQEDADRSLAYAAVAYKR